MSLIFNAIADTFHCDFTHRLNVGHLGNDLLNASDAHSTERGFGMTYLNSIGKTWVLSRLAIELTEMPHEHETYHIETWVESAIRYFTKRNWAITSADGLTTYGYARSIWAMIDTTTRQPQDILAIDNGRIKSYIRNDKECPIADVSRVSMLRPDNYSCFPVCYSDIDVNGHLNSMKYIDHCMDTMPLEYHKAHRLNRLEIAFVSEAYCGENVRVYHAQPSDLDHEFVLAAERDGDTVELARLIINFVEK